MGAHLLGAKGLPGLPEKRHAQRQPLNSLRALREPSSSALLGIVLRLDGVSDARDALQAPTAL